MGRCLKNGTPRADMSRNAIMVLPKGHNNATRQQILRLLMFRAYFIGFDSTNGR